MKNINVNHVYRRNNDWLFGVIAMLCFLAVMVLFYLGAAYGSGSNRALQKMSNSGATAKLIGMVKTPTEGEEVVGTYNSHLGVHDFEVEKTGFYRLYEDPLGGSSYEIRSDWCDTTAGRFMVGGDITSFLRKGRLDASWFGMSTTATDSNNVYLQRAIDAAYNGGGGSVYIPPGLYTLDTTVYLRSGVNICGDGYGTELTTRKEGWVGGLIVFYGEDVNDIEISNLYINPGKDETYAIEHDHCICLYDAYNIKIHHVKMMATGDGVCIETTPGDPNARTYNIQVNDCEIYGAKLNPLHWVWGTPRNAVSVVGGQDIMICNNLMSGFYGPGCVDIEPNGGTYQKVRSVTIQDNTMRCGVFGIRVVGGTEVRGVTIQGNTIDCYNFGTNGRACITMNGNSRGITVVGNTLIGGRDNSYANIMIYGPVSDVDVIGNDIKGGACHGIETFWGVRNINIDNNTIHECSKSGINLYASWADSTTAVNNAGFETNMGGNWGSYGTTYSISRSSVYHYAGTYGWRIMTDDPNEGVQQTIALDDTAFYEATIMVRVLKDSIGGRVKFWCENANWWESVNRTGETDFLGVYWRKLTVMFKPRADAVKLVVTGSAKNMDFVVDDCHVYRRDSPSRVSITRNKVRDCNLSAGSYAGIYVYDGLRLKVEGNDISSFGTVRKNYYGLYVGDSKLSSFKNNTSVDASSNDLYINAGNGLSLSSLGMKNFACTANVVNSEFPYAKTFVFEFDSLTDGEHLYVKPIEEYGLVKGYVSPIKMRLVGVGVHISSIVSAGHLRAYALFSNELEWNVNASGGWSFATIDGTYSQRSAFTNMPTWKWYNEVHPGDFITAMLETDASFNVGAAYAHATVVLVFE